MTGDHTFELSWLTAGLAFALLAREIRDRIRRRSMAEADAVKLDKFHTLYEALLFAPDPANPAEARTSFRERYGRWHSTYRKNALAKSHGRDQ